MNAVLRLLVCCLCAGLVSATEPAAPTMTRIVTRLTGARIDPASFAAKPKTLYLAGDTYARIENEPDPARKVHELIVIHEPNMWIANLLDGTAKHEVDPGPTFVVHCPILPPGGGPKEFAGLEFGREVAFFQARKATAGADKQIDGKSCRSLETTYGDYKLVLYTAADGGQPVQLDVYRNAHLNVSIRFDRYERGLPFAPELFKPPGDLKITEPAKK